MKVTLSIAIVLALTAVLHAQADDEVECPLRTPEPGDEAVLIPHPTDCKLYYVCDNGIPILMKCPKDLHFNPEEKVCDFWWRAGCEDETNS
ncbi:peritrophin-1-like [Pseudomyrmex gracilis]|uniref:peritrophin-1-like n=1 Tax=Pseudomyrmex gracilis TaxID=219809 RepID=UPI000995ADEB|nr:peritrophin-1-like [Pseudomyrmex gracilis]